MPSMNELRGILGDIQTQMRTNPAFLIGQGLGEDDPAFDRAARILEGLLARLSIAILELQKAPKSKEKHDLETLARQMRRQLEASIRRNTTEPIAQLVGEALDKIHELHEYHDAHVFTEVVMHDKFHESGHAGAEKLSPGESFESGLVMLAGLVAFFLQRSRSKRRR